MPLMRKESVIVYTQQLSYVEEILMRVMMVSLITI